MDTCIFQEGGQKQETDIEDKMTRIFATFIVLFCLYSCTKTIYVPTETIKTEYKNSIERDSIYQIDTVKIFSKNDTMYIENIKIKYKEKYIKDTINLTDSIPYPIEVIKEKKIIPNWCWWNLGVSCLFLSIFCIWLVWKIKT